MRRLATVVRSLRSRARFEREMREELAQHVQRRADDLARAGMSPHDALRQARLEFGPAETYKEQCRDASGFAPLRLLHGVGSDVKLAGRRLAATPLFTAFAVLSLGAGLGLTMAAYAVVAAVFFTSSGIADDDRVAFVMTPSEGRLINGGISTPDFHDLRAAQRSFSGLTASATFFPALASPSTTDLIRAEAVDGAYFPVLGVTPVVGRAIAPADVADAAPVVVLSYALWKLRFGSDPAVLGQMVRIAGRRFEIIGVAPKPFEGLAKRFDGTRAWIPLTTDPQHSPAPRLGERDRPRLVVVGRLAPDATITAASAELTSIGAALDATYPRQQGQSIRPTERRWLARSVTDGRQDDGIMRRFGIVMIALIALVLVVACTNLANLVLARGTARQHELSVRRALGASRWRLVREQCAESLILATVGGGVSWILFTLLRNVLDVDLPIGGRLLISFAPAVDPAVLGLAAGALVLSLLVFGLEPALRLTRDVHLRGELAARGGSLGVPNVRRHRTLVRVQVAISTGFFVIATMCLKHAFAEARHDSGVDLNRIAVVTMNFRAQQWDETRARRTLDRVLEEIGEDPVVESAAISSGVPFGASATPAITISTKDTPITDADGLPQGFAIAIAATPRFFQTLGIRIMAGRAFDDRDQAGSPPVVVLSEATARRLFGTSDVVGRQVLVRDRHAAPQGRSVARKLALPTPSATPEGPVRTASVVGIAANTDVGSLFGDEGDLLYAPLAQQTGGFPFGIAIVRTGADPSLALRALRGAVRRVDPDLAVESAGTGLVALGGATVFLRAASVSAVSLGALTMVLAMIGLYGVQSHGVVHRTREIGVRISFGATAAQIRGLVLKDGYRPVLQGIALGILIGFTGRGLLRAYFWEKTEVLDPWMFLLVPLPLVAASFFACYLPARRACRVDPNVALRHL